MKFFRLKDDGQKKVGAENDVLESEGGLFEEKGYGRSRFETGI